MKSTRSGVAIMAVMGVMAAFIIGGCSKWEESRPSMKAPAAAVDYPGGMMMHDMMMKELGQKDANYEARFIDLMIPHHEGAIMMAEDAIEKANRPELRQMAREIIAAQKKEITQMLEWRKQWYGQ